MRALRTAARMLLLLLVAMAAGSWATVDRGVSSTLGSSAGARAFASTALPGLVLTPGLDVANPFVLVEGDQYHVYSTQALFANVPVRSGTEMDDLSWPRETLPKMPPWARVGYTWAPDVRRISDDRYVLWFTAGLLHGRFDAPNASQCIGVAVADNPYGPFRSDAKEPAICQLDRWGSIDPRTFLDTDGQLWVHWKSDDNALSGNTRPASIFAQRLEPDGVTLAGVPIELIEADQEWEGVIVEAPQMVEADGRYWLFYSGNWFNQPKYGLGVAECAGPAGPCRKPFDRPWLTANAQGQGAGEASLFRDDAGWWLAYSPRGVDYDKPTRRPLAIAPVEFGPRGPYLAARIRR